MTTVSLVVHDSLNLQHADNDDYLTLFFPKKNITVQQLIVERVRQEVKKYSTDPENVQRSLVIPTGTERLLNGVLVKRRAGIDVDKQCHIAIDAFRNNGFILLVNDRQVQDLNEVIEIQSDTSVVFVKLTPLVGG